MKQNDLFDEEESKSTEVPEGDELGEFEEVPGEPKKSNVKLLLGIAILLIVGAYAVNTFLFNKSGEVPETGERIPIKAAPATGSDTGVKGPIAEPSKEVPKAEVKPLDESAAKKQEIPKQKAELKSAKPAPEKAARAEVKKTDIESKKTAASIVAKKEVAPGTKAGTAAINEKKDSKEPGAKGLTVIIGTYAAKYEAEAAMEKLKGIGIHHSTRQTKKKLVMNRLLVKELKDKEEVKGLVSDLKASGYEPFTVLKDGTYKVYAVSNYNKETSRENKADLEKLGYRPMIVPTQTLSSVYELVAHAESGDDSKNLISRLEKLGFKPEVGK